ncbi:MAG: hypothetical protein J6B29_05520 [Clostridia bacterium]|nr:hypothetical protein [Clostridia bacterium]
MSLEYYSSQEHNQFSEYKVFPPEQLKTVETKKVAEEENELGHDLVVKEQKGTKKKADGSLFKKLSESISKSVSRVVAGVATTVTVAVATVTVCTSLISSPPNFNINEMRVGNDFVKYEATLEDTDEDMKYSVAVENPYHSFEQTVDEGEIDILVTGLLPGMEYTLSLKGEGESSVGEITYFEEKLYTTNTNTPQVVFDFDLEKIGDDSGGLLRYSAYISDTSSVYDSYRLIAKSEESELNSSSSLENGFIKGEAEVWLWTDIELLVYGITDTSPVLIDKYLIESSMPPPEPTLPEELVGSLTVDESKILVYWDENGKNRIVAPFELTAQDERILYRVFFEYFDGEERRVEVHGTENGVELSLPSDVTECQIFYEAYATDGENEKIYQSGRLESAIDLSAPVLTVTELTAVGINRYRIAYSVEQGNAEEQLQRVAFSILGDGVELEVFEIEDGKPYGSVALDVPYGITKLEIDGSLEVKGAYGGNSRLVEMEKSVNTLATNMSLSVLYDVSSGYVELKPVGYLPTDAVLVVQSDMLTAETELLISQPMSFEHTGEITAYSYYLRSSNGDRLTEDRSFTVDSTVTAEHTFNYKNPGDILITYNDDGTMNLFIITDFATEDPDAYYEITLNYEMVMEFRESVAVISGIEDGSYPIVYRVKKTVDGVDYVLRYIAPSGTVGESAIGNTVSYELSGDVLTLSTHYPERIDFSSLCVQTSSGEIIMPDLDGFVYDESRGEYVVTVTLPPDIEGATVKLMANETYEEHYYNSLTEKTEVFGNMYRYYEIEIQQ